MIYDIAIIGGGPAGLAAAITAIAQNCSVIVFDAHGFSPRLRSVKKVSNYMGIPDISGTELMDKFVDHARKMEIEIIEEKVISLQEGDDIFTIGTPSGIYSANAVLLATGISRSELIPGEKEFLGRGVSYCAKVDAEKYKGKKVVAISTVPNAMDEIDCLAEHCEEVYFFPRYENVVPPKHKNVKVITDEPIDINGTDKVTGLHTNNDYYAVSGVFMFRASDPLNSFLPGLQMRGKSVLVDDQAQTNIEGVFAGGDCTGQPWQVNRAAGQGQKAALSAIKYLSRRDIKFNDRSVTWGNE